MSKEQFNYMDSIYGVLNSPEVEYDDDVIYLDEPDDDVLDFGYDDELAWADDIVYLDEPEDEEVYDLCNLGDGYIPLPQGDNPIVEEVVIDENYVLDECEEDLVEGIVYIDDEVEQMEEIIETSNNTDELINLDDAKSIIKLPGEDNVTEELSITNLSSEDDKIAKAIAREHLDNVGTEVGLPGDEFIDVTDDTSWVDDQDLFGNDIGVILADDPDMEVEDTDYVDGSFEDWLNQNSPMHV